MLHSKWNGKLYGVGLLVGKLHCESISVEHVFVASKQHSDIDLWHQKLGHVNSQHLKEAVQKTWQVA